MGRASRFAAVATAAFILAITGLPAKAADPCAQAGLQVLPAPFSPWKGAPLRVMFTSEKPLDGTMSLTGPDGSVVAKSADRKGGPPYFWFAEVNEPAAGKWQASLALDRPAADCSTMTRDITVSATKPAPVAIPSGKFWQVKGSWDHANETLFSAWISKLFDAPDDQDLNWKAWQGGLGDKSRTFLINYLGRNEDDAKSGLKPDCADFVYFLRAYFAFKMGLPFGYSNCSRGKPPRCGQWFDVEHPEVTRPPPPPGQEAVDQAGDAPPPPPPQQRSGFMRIFGGQEDAPPAETPGTPAAKAPPPKPKRPTNFGEYLR